VRRKRGAAERNICLLRGLLFAIFCPRHVPRLQKGGDPMSSRLLSNVAVIASSVASNAASELVGAKVSWAD
jgi:hypothetical protein